MNTCEPTLYSDESQGLASHNGGAIPKRVSKNKNATKASYVNDKHQGADEYPDQNGGQSVTESRQPPPIGLGLNCPNSINITGDHPGGIPKYWIRHM